jgi:RNA polymerase sigma-70 factor (ECF subfamily)
MIILEKKIFRNRRIFNFSIMSDDCPLRSNKIISDQVEIDIKRLIEALPIDQQEVLVMRMYQDMSFKEISEITGVSINTS